MSWHSNNWFWKGSNHSLGWSGGDRGPDRRKVVIVQVYYSRATVAESITTLLFGVTPLSDKRDCRGLSQAGKAEALGPGRTRQLHRTFFILLLPLSPLFA